MYEVWLFIVLQCHDGKQTNKNDNQILKQCKLEGKFHKNSAPSSNVGQVKILPIYFGGVILPLFKNEVDISKERFLV